MKAFIVLQALVAASTAFPLDAILDARAGVRGLLNQYTQLTGSFFGIPASIGSLPSHVVNTNDQHTLSWTDDNRVFIQEGDIVYEQIRYPEHPQYQLRVRSPELCDPTVKQYSGYLDVLDGTHSLFFWFFEARESPKTAPLILWLNGGPGCSSSTGLLFELGPCSVADEGHNTTWNKHSWNKNANIIFLDQPVGVGYSYSSDGSTINTTPVAAVDVWAFLELFLARFSKYSKVPFHIAAESYGGTYAPNIASVIHKKNKEFSLAPSPGRPKINLSSVILANGLTEPYTQFGKVAEYACEGPYPVWDDPNGPECTSLRGKTPTCQRLINACYNYDSRFTCVPAALYCWSQLYGSFQQMGLNPYDVRRACDREKDGPLCYKQMEWIDVYLNTPEIKKELGVNPSIEFQSCNMNVNQAFMAQGDGMHNSAALLPDLLADGIRLLVYAGNADFMCNFIGNEAWMEALDSPLQREFLETKSANWVTSKYGKLAGKVRSAGGDGFTAGNYTFVEVFEAGHMVPYDQPEAALDLIEHWIANTPLTFQ
ncbi:peptidase S10, serine carboxypeptidase [Sistotremastrum niveocremeum HHB9708]|uniref:Carboxypeptidase n=1 Tax=Sistotremastrum niveocremeum HHB9708 TaxID=1314777 RepID=A0A164UFG3_9AGAM|nr:peptidase S10, serine carboxypeptidase [Sistotremastrum niveocremeum HHB9708]